MTLSHLWRGTQVGWHSEYVFSLKILCPIVLCGLREYQELLGNLPRLTEKDLFELGHGGEWVQFKSTFLPIRYYQIMMQRVLFVWHRYPPYLPKKKWHLLWTRPPNLPKSLVWPGYGSNLEKLPNRVVVIYFVGNGMFISLTHSHGYSSGRK